MERNGDATAWGSVRTALYRLRRMVGTALQKAADHARASISCPITFILMRRIDRLCFSVGDIHAAPHLARITRKQLGRTHPVLFKSNLEIRNPRAETVALDTACDRPSHDLLKPQIFVLIARVGNTVAAIMKNFAHDFWIQGNTFPLGTNCTEVEILWKTAVRFSSHQQSARGR